LDEVEERVDGEAPLQVVQTLEQLPAIGSRPLPARHEGRQVEQATVAPLWLMPLNKLDDRFVVLTGLGQEHEIGRDVHLGPPPVDFHHSFEASTDALQRQRLAQKGEDVLGGRLEALSQSKNDSSQSRRESTLPKRKRWGRVNRVPSKPRS
jgi:hypothetical protein